MINKDREFRRGRWSDYRKRVITRYKNREDGSRASAPIGGPMEDFLAYRDWKWDLLNYIAKQRKDCR